MLPAAADAVVQGYLDRVDQALPGAVSGFYVEGSVALGGFRPGLSDIDFVATIARPLSDADLRTLQAIHRACWRRAASRGILTRSWPLTCNGEFLAEADLRGVGDHVIPLARQIAGHFGTGSERPVNPVTWWTLAHHGVTIRGTPAQGLDLRADTERLRAWTARNLLTYWQPWVEALTGGGLPSWRVRATQLHHRRLAAWGVLGTARMHATLATGQVITKEQAGEYALATFPPRWHPVIRDALGYWRGEPRPLGRGAADARVDTAAFVRHIIAST